MTDEQRVHLWEFPSYRAARRAVESAAVRLRGISSRDDGVSVLQDENGPRAWVIALGPHIDRYTIGGGRYVENVPTELDEDFRRRSAALRDLAVVKGGDVSLHEGRIVSG